jgi:predicted flap endonuclease-1-like 5' DNA nuclease
MSTNTENTCSRNCWYLAGLGGLLLALILWVVATFGILSALFAGLIFAALFGFFLRWAFCGATEEAAHAAPLEIRRAATASAPAEQTSPKAVAPEPSHVAAQSPVPAADMTSPADAMQTGAAKGKAASKTSEPARRSPRAAKPESAAARAKPAARKTKSPAKAAIRKKPATAAALNAALDKSKGAPVGAAAFFDRPRNGRADDLKMIKGVGPKLESLLNNAGVWHFDQIASWKARDIAQVDEQIEGFRGRITRDEWVRQAKVLAAGGTTEFSKRVEDGDVY